MNYDRDMNVTRALLGLASLVGTLAVAPSLASAQRGYPPPTGYYAGNPTLPGGFEDRGGMPMWGFGFGLGNMKLDDQTVTCGSCNYSPIAVDVDGHIGGMLNERFGLMLELQVNAKTVDDQGYGTVSLTQGAAMIAGQYWLSPKLWIKGGIGLAHLSYEYEDRFYGNTGSQPVDDGAALMAGVGYELYSSRTFSVDLQARLTATGYDGIQKNLSSETINVGVNWFGFGNGGGVIVVR